MKSRPNQDVNTSVLNIHMSLLMLQFSFAVLSDKHCPVTFLLLINSSSDLASLRDPVDGPSHCGFPDLWDLEVELVDGALVLVNRLIVRPRAKKCKNLGTFLFKSVVFIGSNK